MRASRSIGFIVLAVSSLAWGQQSSPDAATEFLKKTQAPLQAGQTASMPSTSSTGPIKAYTMVQTETRVQTLPDGSTVTSSLVIKIMRDSNGRTRNEHEQNGSFADAGRQSNVGFLGRREKINTVTVVDPGQHLIMTWNTGPNQAKLVRESHSYQAPKVTRTPMAEVKESDPRAEQHSEDLGKRTVQGLELHGSRNTTTYPTNFDGNSAPYKRIAESWRSSPAQVVMGVPPEDLSDALGVKVTTTLTSFTVGEPDPALFHPPTDYTLWDPNNPADEQGFQ